MKRAIVLVLALLALPLPASGAEAARTAFHCGGASGAIAAMEASYMLAPCWMHVGHHTYDTGRVHRVGVFDGFVSTVEVQFAPPTELHSPTEAALTLEGSVDGRQWEFLWAIPYDLAQGFRQQIGFTGGAGGRLARFLRIRQPQSASQGLSGYLDHSEFEAALDPVHEDPPPASAFNATWSCDAGIMEGFFDAHPCWTGGINRYDSPSVFHTYPLPHRATLTHVSGHVTFAPWRTDDYYSGGSGTEITGFVQASVDGTTWTDLGEVAGVYGQAIPFRVEDPGVEARFVRLVAERHKRYNNHPALKHVRGMLVDSQLSVSASTSPA